MFLNKQNRNSSTFDEKKVLKSLSKMKSAPEH